MEQTLNQPSTQEGNAPVQEQQTAPNPATANAELDQQMRLSLNGFQNFPEQAVQPQTQQTQPATTIAPQQTAATDDTEIVDVDSYWKGFGWDSEEAAKQEIENLRKLKDNPQPQQITYASEESKRLHEAIAAGKRDEVLSILNKQAQIEKLVSSEVSKDTAGDIVKMGMQLKYKDLTPEEINYKFNKQFAIPPKPAQQDLDTDEEYQYKLNAWQEQANDKYMELMIEAKLAKPDIEAAKSKIELPSIQQATNDDYIKFQEQSEKDKQLAAQTKEAYKAFSPKQFETKVPFIDEANKIKFEFQFEPDADSFNNVVDMVSDMDKFFGQFTNSDGSPNREKFLKFAYNGLNAEKMIAEAIRQGGNARFKTLIPDNTNNNGLVRQLNPNVELSDFDKQMRASLSV